ncbi:MAG: hypothetical protein WCX31_12885 [Salinivirgaceae bacterium]|jgi:hypothetical protein
MKEMIKIQHLIAYLCMSCLLLFTVGCKKDETKYSLKLNIVPVGTGTVDLSPSGGTYAEGTVVNLTANSNLGYFFSEWSGDASGTLNSNTITMNSDKIINVSFEEGVFEDFNDGDADYFINDGTSRWNVTNNALIMTGTNSTTAAYSYYPYNFDDFVLSVDMKINKSGTESHAFGIYFKSQSADVKMNSYRLSIMGDGRWYFGIAENGTFSFITDNWIQSSSLNTGLNATNNIKILFVGTQTEIYFNDVYQGYIYNLSTFLSGYVGVWGYDSDAYDNEFSFDNFEIATSEINNLKLTTPHNTIDYDLTKIKGIKRDPDGNKY